MIRGEWQPPQQMSLEIGLGMETTVERIDEAGEHGEVFTRRWVADLILDLSGYTADRDLAQLIAVEPSCGAGAFLVPMVERLVDSCRRHGRNLTEIGNALRAFDLLSENAEIAQKAVRTTLTAAGLHDDLAADVARRAIRCGDLLLSDVDVDRVDFVLGNPPYIRLEALPPELSAAYRRACPTMRGRADIYKASSSVAFGCSGPTACWALSWPIVGCTTNTATSCANSLHGTSRWMQ